MDIPIDRSREPGRLAGKRSAELPVQRGVIGLPHQVPYPDPGEVHRTGAKAQFHLTFLVRTARERTHFKDPPAFLGLVGTPGIKSHAVPRANRTGQPEAYAIPSDLEDFAEKDPAFFSEAGMGQFLVVDAAEPTGVQPPRKRHLQFIPRRRRRNALVWLPRSELIQRLSVNPSDAGHVLRRLETSFDFQGSDSALDELWQDLQSGKILRRQQITAVAQVHGASIRHQFVGQPAGLRAFAAIGAAATQGFAGQALSGVSHAQGAVDEHLQRKCRRLPAGIRLGRADRLDFLQRIFPGQHHQLATQLPDQLHPRGAGHRHLGTRMNRKIGRQPANQPTDADILHDGCVHAGGDEAAQIFGGGRKLVGKHQRIERHVTPHAPPVQKRHQRREIGCGEIARPHPGIEAVESEIDGVRPILHGRAGALPIPGGCEELGEEPAGKGRRFHGHGNRTLVIRRAKVESPSSRGGARRPAPVSSICPGSEMRSPIGILFWTGHLIAPSRSQECSP